MEKAVIRIQLQQFSFDNLTHPNWRIRYVEEASLHSNDCMYSLRLKYWIVRAPWEYSRPHPNNCDCLR